MCSCLRALRYAYIVSFIYVSCPFVFLFKLILRSMLGASRRTFCPALWHVLVPRALRRCTSQLPPLHGHGFDRGRQSGRPLPIQGRKRGRGCRQADRPSPTIPTRPKYRGKSSKCPVLCSDARSVVMFVLLPPPLCRS